MASEAAALFVGTEPASNGRDEVADAGISAPVAIEGALFVEAAVRQDIGLSDIGQAELASPHPLHGFIDEVQATVIKGWVWDPQTPSERIRLELIEGATRVATAVASEDRPGLILSGIGDGQHGFSITLDPELLSAGTHTLCLRSADTGAEVPGSPIVLEGAAGPADLADAAAAQLTLPQIDLAVAAEPAGALIGGSLRSNIDYADWTGIKGWIWDPTDPDGTVGLELLDGDSVLATVSANEHRPDLIEAGIGDGRHGFTIGFTETLLPHARHVLHLRPVGSAVELPSFPMVLTRDHVGFDATAMRFLLGNVTAETERAQEPEDLAPMITNLVELLDQALLQYYALAADKAALPRAMC